MDTKEDAEVPEENLASPVWVLQHLSEEVVRVAGDALHNMYPVSPSFPPLRPEPGLGQGHRRSQSVAVPAFNGRSNSFQRLKTRMQKAWKWGSNSQEENNWRSFNPEVLANQKRQWYRLHSKSLDLTKYKEPTSLFEHFIVVGLHPDANLEIVEDGFAKRKKWELQMANSEILEFKKLQHRAPSIPTLEPQILFRYPPGKRLAIRLKDLAAFCFPGGVEEHLGRDDLAFIFSLKVAGNATLYGVCLHVPEIVQRSPGILGTSSPLSHSSGGYKRFLVSAPRCYCLLTRLPFFELHYEMLNSIIAQERLNRITQFVSELTLNAYVPSVTKVHDQMNGNVESPERESLSDWMASAIPVDSALALTAAAAGITRDDFISPSSLKIWEPHSPESVTTSEASDFSQVREIDKDSSKNSQNFDECTFEASETCSEPSERMCGCFENDQISPEVRTSFTSRNLALGHLGSSESLFSPVRSMESEDYDDEIFANCDKAFGDDLIMEWAKENKNDLLQIVCGYHALSLPPRGSELLFQPLEHLQAIVYMRPPVAALGFHENNLDSLEVAEVGAKLAAAEEALALSIWTTATICRALSLESVLSLVAGVLLEKQVLVVCPNLVLPGRMLDFLDAPVPYIVGIQYKPVDLKMKASNVVHVNVLKDEVKMCHLPALPRHKELVSELGPIHARLSRERSIAKRHPVYRCSDVQAEAAAEFLNVMRCYLESLCLDLKSHAITSVQSNNDRVSLLLKDSFIDSFPSRDRPFMKQFVDTQLFSVLSDTHLSSFENGYS
ncbi:hypothetical protein CFP56_011198 [Quercus suber]|uniref:cDENN domain-containing protein n=1 Tax=Quercus suber TaxID=58331 RepID=A0AAW0MC74_QUESU